MSNELKVTVCELCLFFKHRHSTKVQVAKLMEEIMTPNLGLIEGDKITPEMKAALDICLPVGYTCMQSKVMG